LIELIIAKSKFLKANLVCLTNIQIQNTPELEIWLNADHHTFTTLPSCQKYIRTQGKFFTIQNNQAKQIANHFYPDSTPRSAADKYHIKPLLQDSTLVWCSSPQMCMQIADSLLLLSTSERDRDRDPEER
jgi:hypothetical protein